MWQSQSGVSSVRSTYSRPRIMKAPVLSDSGAMTSCQGNCSESSFKIRFNGGPYLARVICIKLPTQGCTSFHCVVQEVYTCMYCEVSWVAAHQLPNNTVPLTCWISLLSRPRDGWWPLAKEDAVTCLSVICLFSIPASVLQSSKRPSVRCRAENITTLGLK